MARVLNLKQADELEVGDIIAVNRNYRKWRGGEIVQCWSEYDHKRHDEGIEHGADVLRLVLSVSVTGDDANILLTHVDGPHVEPEEKTISVGWEFEVVGRKELPIRIAAIYFNPTSQKLLKEAWASRIGIPHLDNIYCDHVTLAYKPDETLASYLRRIPTGTKFRFMANCWAADSKGQAMMGNVDTVHTCVEWENLETYLDTSVHDDDADHYAEGGVRWWSQLNPYHVTMSTGGVTPPVYSNELISRGNNWGAAQCGKASAIWKLCEVEGEFDWQV